MKKTDIKNYQKINKIVAQMLLGYKRIEICNCNIKNCIFIKRETEVSNQAYTYFFYYKDNKICTDFIYCRKSQQTKSNSRIIKL